MFSLHNFMNFSNPALRTLLPTIGAAYAFQIAVSIPNVYFQEDRFYGLTLSFDGGLTLDLSGSVTYIGCTALSLYLPALRARSLARSQRLPTPGFPSLTSFHPRQLIMSGLTLLWAFRLGSFLFQRVLQSGGDSRFDKLKKKVLGHDLFLLMRSLDNIFGFGSVKRHGCLSLLSQCLL